MMTWAPQLLPCTKNHTQRLSEHQHMSLFAYRADHASADRTSVSFYSRQIWLRRAPSVREFAAPDSAPASPIAFRSRLVGLGRLLTRWPAAAVLASVLASVAMPAQAGLVIAEFRVRGPSSANDEFVTIYNDAATAHTVAAASGTGYALAASDGVTRFTIPNGTVIPAHGFYLGVNSGAYSLSGNATGDATYTADIPDNAGIALFNTSVPGNFNLVNRLDAVGSTSEANTLYKEGAGYRALTPFSIDYSFYRDVCGKGGSITTMGPCPTGGTMKDTGDNAADFVFVDTNGTSAGAGQRLGAPGPRNLSSPTWGTGDIAQAPLDDCVAVNAAPNRVRDFTSDPPNNSTFGTLDLRGTFTNNTGAPLTRLRFRVIDLTTFPAPSGFADLRPRTSTAVVATVDRAPCGSGTSNVTVQGTTLEQPPSQPNGGGFNSTLSVGSVTAGTPLANGASIDVRFLMGIQQRGAFKLRMLAEGLGKGGSSSQVVEFEGHTEGVQPTVTINQASGQADPTAASPINFTVVFSEAITGFTDTDVQLSGTAGATSAVVTGGPTTYNVAVSGMTANGTVIASIPANAAASSTSGVSNLASTSTDNTVTYNGIDVTAPTVTVNQASAQVDPSTSSPINFTVVFSEDVTGFTNGDVQLSGTAGATTATVTGGPAIYNVAVSGMTNNGTVVVSVPAGAATDAGSNSSSASTSTDNSVTYAVMSGAVAAVPTLGEWGLMLLGLLAAGLGMQRLRHR